MNDDVHDLFHTAGWVKHAAAALAHAGIGAPAREARLLLAHVTGRTLAEILATPDAPVPAAAAAVLARRCRREPLALITGHQGFWTLELSVSPATLIPRADSETLVEAALDAFPDRGRVRRILDLGTGTGCLLLALLTEFPGAWGTGTDRRFAAARLARGNAVACGLAARSAFLAGDWGTAVAPAFDLVVANPPYIASGDIPGLMQEVAGYEPASALDGGPDGLAAYRALLPDLVRLLAPDGVAILELGAGQEAEVRALAEQAGLACDGHRTDLGGIVRALTLRRTLP